MFPQIVCSHHPKLDPGFIPAVLWNRAYRELAARTPGSTTTRLGLDGAGGHFYSWTLQLLPPGPEFDALTLRYVERFVKFILWHKGGWRVSVEGRPELVRKLRGIYAADGARKFDWDFMGQKIYGHPFEVTEAYGPAGSVTASAGKKLGGHLDGCRIGFDLGGSDRKCAALIDGKVVFSEEVAWSPYFEPNPSYHYEGIRDTLKRAAAHLPRIDAIGGSAAGVYIDNEPKVASLFRGVATADFDREIRPIFRRLKKEWNNVPFEVINDGEVTALAGSMAINDHSVLGISLGTSQAVGYVTPEGELTTWLNELSFAPLDFSPDAPVEEWSGDMGCGARYFSQQAISRLAERTGIYFDKDQPLPERLVAMQALADRGDARALDVFRTIGGFLAHATAQYAEFYKIKNLLLLGRVMSGAGGETIIAEAKRVLEAAFPEIHQSIRFVTPDEKQKRHGQAIAAASLPEIPRK